MLLKRNVSPNLIHMRLKLTFMQDVEKILHHISHNMQLGTKSMENVTGSESWEYFQTIFFATLAKDAKCGCFRHNWSLCSVCESSYKYDSNMEILLTLMLETFRNPIYQSFATAVKFAAIFILKNFILHNQVCT